MSKFCCFLSAATLMGAPAAAEPLTPSVRAMVEKAARSGDGEKADTVAGFAKELHPESAEEIDAIVAAARADREAARLETIANARLLENWMGTVEVGGSIATGNSDTLTFSAGLNLKKESLHWRHSITGLADIQRNDGVNSQHRLLAGYQVDRTIAQRLYTSTSFGFERNEVAGLNSRFTEALNLGYKVIDRPNLSWRLEGGPALRQAKFTDRSDNGLAVRAASEFGWDISSRARLTQTTTGFVENRGESVRSSTALTSQLRGALAARLSLNVQYESNPPPGDKKVDTVTRATLIYGF